METDGLPDSLRDPGISADAKLVWILMQNVEPVDAFMAGRVFGLSEQQAAAGFSQLRSRELVEHTDDGYVRDVGGGEP